MQQKFVIVGASLVNPHERLVELENGDRLSNDAGA